MKPAYNVQMATNGQYILNYDIFQRPTDTKTLIPFLNKMKDGNRYDGYEYDKAIRKDGLRPITFIKNRAGKKNP